MSLYFQEVRSRTLGVQRTAADAGSKGGKQEESHRRQIMQRSKKQPIRTGRQLLVGLAYRPDSSPTINLVPFEIRMVTGEGERGEREKEGERRGSWGDSHRSNQNLNNVCNFPHTKNGDNT